MLGKNAHPAGQLRAKDSWTQGPFRVMLVENAEDDRACTLEALSHCDMVQEVLSYPNASALIGAMHAMRKEEDSLFHMMPTLLLLGLNLPATEGFRTLRHLRSEKHLAGVPVIVLSDVLDAKQVQELDAEGFLHKPLDALKLQECLEGKSPREEVMKKI